MCCIPAAGIAKCSQLTSSFQVRQHGLPFPAPIMVKIKPTGPLSSSQGGEDTNQGQHSSFLPHLSVPSPPIQVNCTQPPLWHTEQMTSKSECSKGRSQIFLAAILFADMWTTNRARNPNLELRNAEDLYVPAHKFASLKRLPYFLFPKIWNEANIFKRNPSKCAFTRSMKIALLNEIPN
jgi:hypothetical protein